MNYKETICVTKVINDFNRKEVDYVTRRPAPILTGRAVPSLRALREGLSRGALGEALTGGPHGGGVLRWELARAPIQYTIY